MRQRYREYSFDEDNDKPMNSTMSKARYVPQDIGAKFDPPSLYLFFKETGTGKLKRRKMPVRDFVVVKDQKVAKTEDVAKQLVARHEVLASIPIDRVVALLTKLRTHLKIPEPAPVLNERTGVSLLPEKLKLSDLPPLPSKSLLPIPMKAPADNVIPTDKPSSSAVVDGNLNLNKMSDHELSQVKSEMNTYFEKNRIKPGDPGFQYDVQKKFEPASEENDWDSSSSVSGADLKSKDVKPVKNANRAFGDLETDDEESKLDDELSAMNDEISAILDDIPAAKLQTHNSASVAEKDEESGAASSTVFWWMKETAAQDILKRDSDVPSVTAVANNQLTEVTPGNVANNQPKSKSMFDPVSPPNNKSPIPVQIESMPEQKPLTTLPVGEITSKPLNSLHEDVKKAPENSVLLSSGMSATMAALQQAKALLDQSKKVELAKDEERPKEERPKMVQETTKLGPLPSLSKLPTLSAINNPLGAPKDISPVTSAATDKSYSTPQSALPAETILNIDLDEDIDAGFANYDADADGDDGDFMDLIMPKKNIAPILPLSQPKSMAPESNLKEIIVKREDEQPPKPSFATPSLLNKIGPSLSPAVLPNPTTDTSTTSPFINQEIEDVIDEDFDNYDPEKDSEEDLSFLAKSHSTKLKGVEPILTPIVSKTLDVEVKPSLGAGLLGPLPSLLNKSVLQTVPVLPQAIPIQTVEKIHSAIISTEMKKAANSKEDIPEDFDFEMDANSISDLLGDTNEGAAEKRKAAVGMTAASLKGLIPGIPKNDNNAMLDKFAETAMKILSDDVDVTSKKSADYTEDFGAGDTDSEGEMSKISAIADQSPAFKKNVKFLSDNEEEDDEFDDLFRDDDIDLEVDDEPLTRDENDDF
ncbi:CEP19-like protein-domain-containing protein [Obelidium mucronatum]|nr:CEP19-like protein-domain-containing protein [Obelidium mucronatum]